jgi:hypothetical protein
MKKTGCVMAMAVMFFLSAFMISDSAYAVGCKDLSISCCIDGNDSQTVAKTPFSMCWSWKDFICVPCHGGHKWAYLAKWCNENNGQCKGRCKACHAYSPSYTCADGRICWDQEGRSQCQ